MRCDAEIHHGKEDFLMQRAEIVSQILAVLEDVAEISPEDVNEDSVLMDDLDLSSMEILTIVADLEETLPAVPRHRAAAGPQLWWVPPVPPLATWSAA